MTPQPSLPKQFQVDLTVVILTLNEEKNIRDCIDSVKTFAKDIVVVDSFSNDATLEILKNLNVRVIQNKFVNYSKQRNFALKETSIKTEWILMLDADERVSTELADELSVKLNTPTPENGFKIKRRLYWYGRWIKRGYYPVWLLRVARSSKVRCEDRVINEHLEVEGTVGELQSDIIHEDFNGIDHWHLKHFKYAELEAQEFFKSGRRARGIKRWLQYNVWDRLPVFLRPWFYFGYRYLLRGGFLEGWQGLSYHFFQALWLQFLIGLKIKEIKQNTHRSAHH